MENTLCRVQKLRIADCGISARNKTEFNNTHMSNTNLSIDYDDVLAARDYGSALDEIIRLMTDTYCCANDTVWINKRIIPIQTVRKQLSMLTAEHIEYLACNGNLKKRNHNKFYLFLLCLYYFFTSFTFHFSIISYIFSLSILLNSFWALPTFITIYKIRI